MPLVRSIGAASLMLTALLVPLNESALPKRPRLVQVADCNVPVRLLPERSAVVEPVPSSKP